MSNNQRKESAFSSLRILSRKAQELMNRAKEERERRRMLVEAGQDETKIEEAQLPEQTVHLSVSSVAKAAIVILGIIAGTWLTIQLIDTIILLLLSFFVAAIIDPGVRTMEKWGIPRGLGILIQYAIALLIFFFLILSLIPIIGDQLHDLAVTISQKIDLFLANPKVDLPLVPDSLNLRLTEWSQAALQNLSANGFADTLQNFALNLSSAAQGSVRFATQLAGSVLSFFVRLIVVVVLAFFIQMERESIRSWVRGFLPHRYRSYIDSKSEAIHYKIAQWARGQLLLAVAIGLLVFIALKILGMPYALTLAALSAFTEFIPYIGPLIGAVPAILIALTQEGIAWALVVAGVFYIVQWCENNLLVPLIMKRAVGLSPVVIIVAMLIGVSFPDYVHPVLGILLAVPVATIITLFLDDWREHRLRKS